jgi:branched-chain amino acid aminotransferase
VKCNANYQNGRLAGLQAKADGYDTAILLNTRGRVAEGPGMCFFMIRDGVASTPHTSSDILESITRSTVLELLREAGFETQERDIDRSELAAAEEAFFCGTAWEITPVVAIDKLNVGAGEVGPVVRELQERFFSIVRGESDDHPQWRTPVYEAD